MENKPIDTLDVCVNKALDFFAREGDYDLDLPPSAHTLVVGSQNGWLTGRVLYRFAGRAFSHAAEALAQDEIDTKTALLEDVTIVSATGGRNVVPIARYAMKKGLRVNAIVCNPESQVSKELKGKRGYTEIYVPAIEEPPTINTATYGRMIQGVTHENIKRIRRIVDGLVKHEGFYERFEQFTILLPDHMSEVAFMADWKMNEVFGRQRGSRTMYWTNAMHGGTVRDGRSEAYIGMGVRNRYFGAEDRRQHIPLPKDFGPLGYLLVAYSVIGRIQRVKKDRGFQENILRYKAGTKGWDWASPVCSRRVAP